VIDEATAKAVGIPWLPGRSSAYGGDMTGADHATRGAARGSGASNAGNVLPLSGLVGKAMAATNAGSTNAMSYAQADPTSQTVAEILAESRYRSVLRALELRGGVEILSAPGVTTINRRQAQIQAKTTNIIVTLNLPKLETNSLFTGLTVDVVPRVLPDNCAIHLDLEADLTEFLGYVPAGANTGRENTATRATSQSSTSPWAQPPQSRHYYARARVTVRDGQTVLIVGPKLVTVESGSGGTGPPQRGAEYPHSGAGPLSAFRAQTQPDKLANRELLLFITPTIVGPAGDRINGGEPLPFHPDTIPPQSSE